MTQELEHDCPYCESETFYRAGSTLVQLGEKVKWSCTGRDCSYGFVHIGSEVDSSLGVA